jgi:hypothetical protein
VPPVTVGDAGELIDETLLRWLVESATPVAPDRGSLVSVFVIVRVDPLGAVMLFGVVHSE